ncbi:MAG: hypothetical protein PHS14_11305 [Elusimicrobia bacterium]|nr:hypothetical protein [Elusimicrobiota bacterium]
MTIRILFLVMSLTVVSQSAEFDQGKFEGMGPPLIPRVTADAPALPKGVVGLEIATTHTRLQSYLSNNGALNQMSGLLRDSRMGRLPLELQKRLQADGAEFARERDVMLPDAANLDQEDTGLVIRRDELTANKAKLDARLTELDRQGAEHEAACLPTHPPERHAWCVENARRLNALIGRYNADVKVHNDAVAKWKDDVSSLQPRWDVFVQKIIDWENQVKVFIETIKKAFDGGAEICTLVNPPLVECIYSCPSGETVALAFPVPGEPSSCAASILHSPRPPARLMHGQKEGAINAR